MVIDTPIHESQLKESYMCRNGSVSIEPGKLSYFKYGESVEEVYHHGQNVVGLIGNRINSDKYCIYHIAYYFPKEFKEWKVPYMESLAKILTLKNVVGVNLSIADSTNEKKNYMDSEFRVIDTLTKANVKVVVAAGNNNEVLKKEDCNVFPVCLKLRLKRSENMYVVGSDTYVKNKNGTVHKFSNISIDVDMIYEDGVDQGVPAMTGTSQSAAKYTGRLFSR